MKTCKAGFIVAEELLQELIMVLKFYAYPRNRLENLGKTHF